MADDLTVFLSLDVPTLKRRIENEEKALAAFQRHADLVNKILGHIDNGTIDYYCAEWSQSIKTSTTRLQKLNLALMSKSL